MRFRPSIYLGRWFGVEIRIDAFILIIIGLLFFASLNDASVGHAPAGELWSAVAHLVLLVALMFCMFLHEVGHATMCRLRGHRAKMILVSFIGFTFFEAKSAKPSDEFFIALAGPMVNLAIGLALSPFIGVVLADRGAPALFSQASLATTSGFLATLSLLNFGMGIGNLIPGWPADGARAVRAWLSRKRGYPDGTRRAVKISHGVWFIMAGVAVLVLTLGPLLQGFSSARPTRTSLSMIQMYQWVVLLLAAMGVYYGWAENRRVKRLGERAESVGPPEEFMPRKRDDHPNEVEAEVVDGGRENKPKEPSKVDEVKKKAQDGIAAGKVLWRVAKASGKGVGWFAKMGLKMMADSGENNKKKKK